MIKDAPIHPYIPVSDLKRARRFYEETLGLKRRQESEEGVLYEGGKGTQVFVYRSAGAGTNKASTAFWVVENIETEVAALRAKGVVFEEYDMPGIKTVNGIAKPGNGPKIAWFKDPEGNILAVTER